MKDKIKIVFPIIFLVIAAWLYMSPEGSLPDNDTREDYGKVENAQVKDEKKGTTDLLSLEYEGKPYVSLGKAKFTSDEMTTENYKHYSELDSLGRCGPAMVCISRQDMPNEKRGSIGMVKPSGWHTVRYDDVISDRYLYNRCHLVAWSLSSTLADERNLITGTRYMNIDGMCDQEEMIRDYIRNTDNHVIYRVTPIFKGNDLVARGVRMEAKSVEDNGKGINFDDYAFNVQPGIVIDYATGDSHRE